MSRSCYDCDFDEEPHWILRLEGVELEIIDMTSPRQLIAA